MKKAVSKANKLTGQPPEFPALTKDQRDWVAVRRKELKSAIDAGIESGQNDGYRAFDAQRILAFIMQRRAAKPVKRVKRA